MVKTPGQSLLDAAIGEHKSGNNTFIVKPWREIMTKPLAKAKANERKEFLKTHPVPKHESGAAADVEEGVDTIPRPMLQSGHSVFNPSTQPPHRSIEMNDQVKNDTVAAAEKSVADQKAAAQAQAQEEKRKAKLAAEAAAAEKKAERDKKAAEAKTNREAAAKAATEKKAERERVAGVRRAEREEAERKAREAGHYAGSMTALAERVRQGVYVKSMTGQLRSNDDVAQALDAVPAINVVKLGLIALALPTNPYAELNIGQQSMNLRNRMRGAVRKGQLTIARIKEIRDENNFATAEDEIRKKQEAKLEREQKAAAAKAERDKQVAESQAKREQALKEKAAAAEANRANTDVAKTAAPAPDSAPDTPAQVSAAPATETAAAKVPAKPAAKSARGKTAAPAA